MKVVIVSTTVPGVRGGAALIVEWLAEELAERGHDVDTLLLPFHADHQTMAAQMVGIRMIDLTHVCDRVVTIRTPAHLVRHPRKVVWFIHHHRGLFDLYGTVHQEPGPGPATDTYRRMFRDADDVGLREAHAVFSNSATVSARLRWFNDIESEVLYPPVRRPDRFRNDGGGDYVLGLARVAPNKRPALLLDALAATRSEVRLVLAGASDDPAYAEGIRSRARDLGLERRVEIHDHWITEETKIDLLAGCLAVAYVPLDEDSYGYASLEAHLSGKAVITATDSGGTLELVRDGVNGLVVEPTPSALAAAFDDLYGQPDRAAAMGHAGTERMVDLGIDWDHVIGRLLA